MRTRKHRLKGGDVFEGSEGCVFTPELKSKDGVFTAKYPSRSGKYVTKVYVRPSDLQTEIKGIALIRQVDPTGEFTKTFVDNKTKADISSITPQEKLKCKKPITDESPMLYLEYGGISIQSLKKTGRLNEVLKPVLSGLASLGTLFVKMANIGIVHSDVQPGNLLFNRKDNKVYLIDFTSSQLLPGLTDRSQDIKSLGTVILNLLIDYQKQVGKTSKCGMLLSDIITIFQSKINSTKDVEVIDMFIENTVNSVMSTCFVGGRRKTLRRIRH